MRSIDKRALLAQLIAQLEAELARAKSHAEEAAAGATHEENRAESDKDMRSTEASYVARGHAERSAQLEQALVKLARMEVKSFGDDAAIETSALVEVEHAAKRTMYFLVPAAGGERIDFERASIHTLTPTSPLGRALLGLSRGDVAEVETPQGQRSYTLLAVR